MHAHMGDFPKFGHIFIELFRCFALCYGAFLKHLIVGSPAISSTHQEPVVKNTEHESHYYHATPY